MKKFNFITVLLLLFVSTVMFTACSNSNDDPTPDFEKQVVGTWESSFMDGNMFNQMTFTIKSDHTFSFESILVDEVDDLFDGEWTYDESQNKIIFTDPTDPYDTRYHVGQLSDDFKTFIITWDDGDGDFETVNKHPFYKK